MDPGAIKRPRSLTPTSSKGGVENRKKKAKKKKERNNRQSSESVPSFESTTSSQERLRHHKETATAEGHRMAQMLATMGTVEQSRFQAFKRSCFSADAVQAWVAACLRNRYPTTRSEQCPPLADLVAVGQASEIGLVVATAAKVYAQRLIADAIAWQKSQRQAATTSPANRTPSGPSASTVWPTSVAVWTAVSERQRRGIDPGFFLHPAPNSLHGWTAARVSSVSHYNVRRHAALAAQEAYDERRSEEPSETDGQGEEQGRSVDMDIDTSTNVNT